MSVPVRPGQTIPLTFTMPDGDGAKFPRVRVYDFPANTEATGSPVSLAHVVNGLYVGSFAVPATGVFFTVNKQVFDDAGFITPTAGQDIQEDLLVVTEVPEIQIGVEIDQTVDPNKIQVHAWLEKSGLVVVTGLATGVMDIFDQAGATLLTGPVNVASPDAQGVFLFEVDDPGLPIGVTKAYVKVTMEENGAEIQGITSITFTRRS